MESKVKCDEQDCDWKKPCEREDIASWHRKPCPKCGKGEIVNDAELSFLRIGIAVEALENELYPDEPKVIITVDTARLIRGV